jgi:hypothetical protein
MANMIAFQPSPDPTVTPSGSYVIEGSPSVTGPWTVVATVPAAMSGTYWNSTASMFIYMDESIFRPYNTWYHVIDVDFTGKMGRPSDPFMTHPTPYFVVGSTPFGVFDQDIEFQKDADRIADFVRKKLGEPVMQVHLSSTQIYAAFEEACLEYSAMVNSYQAKSTLSTFLGSPTGTLSGSENKYPNKVLSLEQASADPYNADAMVNSSLPLHSASITLAVGQQAYDIPTLLSQSGQWDGVGHIRIREVYHKSPMAAYRFFGTTSGLNYLNSQFRFESFTPETLFYLLPIWEDVLRGMQFKTSQNVRRSNYSFDLHNNTIRLYPVPQDQRMLWFTYTIDAVPQSAGTNASGSVNNPGWNGVSNISNIPFGNIQYSQLNSISRQWIRQMAAALAKEIEGQIRSKFQTVPIPNGDVTLNGPSLILDARGEMETLRAQLKEMLEETTYQKLMEKEATMAQNLQETWKGAPMGIFIG